MKSIDLLKKMLDGKDYCEVEKKDSEGNYISVTVRKNQSYNSNKNQIALIDIIPKQYVEFLLFSDGMELFNYDNLDGIKLLSLQEIEKYTNYCKNTFEEDWQDNIIIFAKIIGEDNYLGFRMKENYYEIIDCYFEESPSEWAVIAYEFDEFLEKYITEKGEKYWIY